MCVFYFHKSSFYFKEQSPKRKFEVNVKKCIPSKWAKLFLTRTKEHKYFMSLSSYLVLKNSMKTFPPGTGLKNVFKWKMNCCNSQNFLMPCARLKAAIKSEILKLGSWNKLTQHGTCPIFSLEKSLHPTMHCSHHSLIAFSMGITRTVSIDC